MDQELPYFCFFILANVFTATSIVKNGKGGKCGLKKKHGAAIQVLVENVEVYKLPTLKGKRFEFVECTCLRLTPNRAVY